MQRERKYVSPKKSACIRLPVTFGTYTVRIMETKGGWKVMRTRRIIAALAAVIVLFLFASCKKKPAEVPEDGTTDITVSCLKGTDGCWTLAGSTLTFTEMTEDTTCSISGKLYGNIVIDAGDGVRFELELSGLTVSSRNENPITVLSGDKVTLTAKKDTENAVYDRRVAIGDDAHAAAIWADTDLTVDGKGSLNVVSEVGNGIHTKDDLTVKNLTLSVTCRDNALKGNDSVTVAGGTIRLVASAGDGIKTKNTDVSAKGKQRGTVMLSGCTAEIYAACDGIDAAYDAVIEEDTVLSVYTDSYSEYTDEAAANEKQNDPGGMEKPGTNDPGGRGGPGVPGGGWGGPGGGWGGPGDRGGPGGMTDGNTDKAEHSAKGIKAGNEILVSGGTVYIQSYDDALHAGTDDTLENGAAPTGNVTVSGGTLELNTNDDAIHADGTLTVSSGRILVSNSYEGLEGTTVLISGGDVSINSKDDGINATKENGVGVTFTGGTTYIYAGGDGIDANSRTSYEGIVFAGGDVTVISTSGGNSSIDTEQGYTYTGGRVLALCPSGGMSSEATKCRNFSSVGTKTNLSLKNGQTLAVTVGGVTELSVKMPSSLSALVIYLGATGAVISAQ